MSDLINIIALATVAGLLSSVLGGVIAIVFGRPNKKFIGVSFTFAASVLITLVFVDFLEHAVGHGHYHTGIDPVTGGFYQYWYQHAGAGIWLTMLGIAIGVGLVAILSWFDRYGHEHIHGVLPHTEECSHEEEESGFSQGEKRRMIVAAIPVAFAIILHDLPKGLAIGSAGSFGAAILIGISCIPEGMTIAIPLKAGGVKWWKILSICGVAGLATVLGAVIGHLVGGINVYLSGMMFAIAAGCILAVVFWEILPMATEYAGRTRWKLLAMLLGVLVVFAFYHFFHDLMH